MYTGTALSLLEAQAATGSIIDPISGDMMGVSDALERKLLDRSFAAVLSRAERAVTGYQVRGTTEVMSLFQAMQSVSPFFTFSKGRFSRSGFKPATLCSV